MVRLRHSPVLKTLTTSHLIHSKDQVLKMAHKPLLICPSFFILIVSLTSLSLTHSTPDTPASLVSLQHARHACATGPLHWNVQPPDMCMACSLTFLKSLCKCPHLVKPFIITLLKFQPAPFLVFYFPFPCSFFSVARDIVLSTYHLFVYIFYGLSVSTREFWPVPFTAVSLSRRTEPGTY